MNIKTPSIKYLFYILFSGLSFISCSRNEFVINDINDIFGKTEAPLSIETDLSRKQFIAAKEGRLGISGTLNNVKNNPVIPVQLSGNNTDANIIAILPGGKPGNRKFRLVENKSPFNPLMKVELDPESGQFIIKEKDTKVLQYNYQTVYEKDVIRLSDEKQEEFQRAKNDTFITTSIYAVPRSDYIHPLYGLNGEMLTRDWPDGNHPHHRAIFWAWPEVEYGSERGDIYALQRVFARPTGNIEYTGGPVFAQINAENLWMWEDKEPIVREHAIIRVYRASSTQRIIDLTIILKALKDSITIATRHTDSYGGLNLRMMTPGEQKISFHTDDPGSEPLRAWSDFNGIFSGNATPSGLMVLQHHSNPEYPGAWVQYPNLAWIQPTFPTPGTRFPLSIKEPLVLRYRLVVHAGGKPERNVSEMRWDAFNSDLSPMYSIH